MAQRAAARLYRAFIAHDPAQAIAIIEHEKAGGTPQAKLFDRLYAPAMSMLGGAWASGVVDEYAFTQAAVVAEQIASFVSPPLNARDTGVTVIIGVMHRDTHVVDKNITAAALKEAGHRVVDLGADVRPSVFLERAEETGARIVIVFASTVSVAGSVSRVSEMLIAGGREDVSVLVAGGPFWADVARGRAVGAVGVVKGAESALTLVSQLERRQRSEYR